MTVNKDENIKHRRWMSFLVAAIVIVGLILIYKERDKILSITDSKPSGDLMKMIGAQGRPPEELPSYQAVSGVLNIQHWQTEKGVRVYFVPVDALPMVDIQMVFDAGAAREKNKPGLALITTAMLAEGTAKLTADHIAENFENVGALFSSDTQRDMAVLSLRSLSYPEQLLPAVETLADIVQFPSFPEKNFQRISQNMLSALKQEQQKPGKIATRAFFDLVYQNQPYANWPYGNEAGVKALTVSDAKTFYQQFYVAKNAVISIVGNLSATEANAIATKLTEHLPEGEKAATLPDVTALSKTKIENIQFPSEQTHIMMGEAALKQGSPDYYALALGNHILGGNGSVSRIFNIVRAQHGLAYSAYSMLAPMQTQGPFIIGCQTRNDQALKALKLLEETLADYVQNGPTEQELIAAKQNILGGFALKFSSNRAIANYASAIGFYGLPMDYYDQYKPRIEKLTADDVKAAFQKHIDPRKLAVVVVGSPTSDEKKQKLAEPTRATKS